MFARRANGWRLVTLLALAGGSFAVEEAAPFSAQLHTVLQVVIFLLALALMALWVRRDATAAYAEEAARLMLLDLVEVPTSNFQPPASNFRVTMSLEAAPHDRPEIKHVARPDRSEAD